MFNIACQIDEPAVTNMPLAGMSSRAVVGGVEDASITGGDFAGVPTAGSAGEVAGIRMGGNEPEGGVMGGADAGVDAGAGAELGGGVMGGQPPVSLEPGYALHPAEGVALVHTVAFNSSLTLSARYTFSDGETITGVPAQAITLRLLDPTGFDRTATGYLGSRLQSSRVMTNAEGVASFNLFIAD